MSDVDFKIGANSTEANAALDKVATKAMTTGQRIQSSMREATYNMASGMKNSVEGYFFNNFKKIPLIFNI